jgi:hypothetical protein
VSQLDQQQVSSNRLEGALGEVSLHRLLEACRQQHITGTIRIVAGGGEGSLELRAGVVDDARFGDLNGAEAVRQLHELADARYEITQKLPDIKGELVDSATAWGELGETDVVAVMRHCEAHALTCTITVVSEFDRGVITYRTGEIVDVELNGEHDDDRIGDILSFASGRFRLMALPLQLDLEGARAVTRVPTEPLRIASMLKPRLAQGTEKPMPVAVKPDTDTGRTRRPRAILADEVAEPAAVGGSEPGPAPTAAEVPPAPTSPAPAGQSGATSSDPLLDEMLQHLGVRRPGHVLAMVTAAITMVIVIGWILWAIA